MSVSRSVLIPALLSGALIASLAVSTGCTATVPSGGANSAGEALVQRKCSMCHTLERVNQAKKDNAGWVATVDRMRGKGAILTDAEAKQVTDYLTAASGSK